MAAPRCLHCASRRARRSGRRVVWFRMRREVNTTGDRVWRVGDRRTGGAARRPARGPARRRARHLGRGARRRRRRAARWGRLARELVSVSGVVPTLLSVTGACVSGPALALGCFDQVVMTDDAFAFVTGPESIADFTGDAVSRAELGGSAVHDRRTGVAALVVRDEVIARDALAAILSYLPDHHLADPPRWEPVDSRPSRRCRIAADTIPNRPNASYDVRAVIDDVVDTDSRLELRRLRTEPRHRARHTRRAADRRRRQPARAPRGHARHRSVAQGRALHRVVRRVQPPDRHLRRHARLRAGPRPRVAAA